MRILVSKPDSLGDQLIIAGWVQALAEAVPGGRVVWHVQAGLESVSALLEGTSVFQPSLAGTPEDEAARFNRECGQGLILLPFDLPPFGEWTARTDRQLDWWTRFLGANAWDAAVAAVGNRTWVAEVSVAATRAPLRIGAQPTPSRQTPVNAAGHFLSQHAPTFHREVPYDVEAPEGESLGRLISALGFPLPAKPTARLRPANPGNRIRRILLAPGVGGPVQRAWPVTSYLALARQLQSDGWTVEWIEGPSDRAFIDPIRTERDVTLHTHSAQDFPQLADRLRTSEALVCNDTAYAHLAALLDLPTVAIFGGGQRARFHPQVGRVRVVQGLPPCAGCQWHCLFSHYPCIAEIPVSTVATALRDLLGVGDQSPVVLQPALGPLLDAPALVKQLQEEILRLDADRFARLQIIQTLLDTSRRAALPCPEPRPAAAPPIHETELLSIIIPAGRPDRVQGTLASLAAQTPPPADWEVIVAGAGLSALTDTPGSLPLERVDLPRRVSPAQTRIAGVTAAKGSWYLFVDDDIELAPDFLARARMLMAGLQASEPGRGPGAIGARLPGRTGRFWERITDLSNFWSQQSLLSRACEWLYSATLLVRAEAYRESGGFDPTFPVGEDVDLTQRIRQAGYSVRYEPSLVAYHDHRRDTPSSVWRYFWRNGEGARFFFRGLGGACAFSIKTVWLKTWSDLRMNREFQRAQGTPLGLRAPLVWLNYLIVETSLEWHWQRHLHDERRYLTLPARLNSDRTYVAAMRHWDGGRHLRGSGLYALAMLQDFANPLRR